MLPIGLDARRRILANANCNAITGRKSMNRLLRAAARVALSVLFVLAAGGPTAAQERSSEARVGREMFLQYCGACHGKDARGDGPVAKSLKTQPADLTRIAERRGGEFPAAEIAMFIDGRTVVPSHGTREMPVWGRKFREQLGNDDVAEEITRGRIDVLVAYLQSIQTPVKATTAPPEKDQTP
jgi:mono/diheme cytochrome c family protein